MARKRTELEAKHTATLVELMRGGRTARQIAEALAADGAKGVSAATVGRRMTELRGPQRTTSTPVAEQPQVAPVADPTEPPLPDSPEAIPEGTDLETLDRWIERADRNADAAEARGDLAGLGSMGRLAKGLLDAKIKATPRPAANPNDDPDMQEMGAKVAERFFAALDEAAGPVVPRA